MALTKANVRIEPRLKDRIKALAWARGISESEWMREKLRRAADSEEELLAVLAGEKIMHPQEHWDQELADARNEAQG